MSRIIIPVTNIDNIILHLPLLERDNANGDYNDSATVNTADVKITYYKRAVGWTTLTSTATIAQQASDTGIYTITLGWSSLVDIDDSYPISISVRDQTATKTYVDTGVELYIDSFVDLGIDCPNIIDIGKSGVFSFPIKFNPVCKEGKRPIIDDDEIAIKAYYPNGSTIANFYDDNNLSVAATASTTFPGSYKVYTTANGIRYYLTFFKVDPSFTEEFIIFEFVYKVLGDTRFYQKVVFLQDVDNRITTNDSIISVLADTNEIQGKLPTNYIMGSSDQNNYNSEISNIDTIVDLALPDIAPSLTGGLPLCADDSNNIAGITGTKNTFDDLNDITVADILSGTIDGLTVSYILELAKASVNSKFSIDTPNPGDVTFFKEDGVTPLTIINVNSSGRTKVS